MRAMGHADGGFGEIELPIPEPGAGEVRVRVAASSINPADEKVVGGEFVGRVLHGRVRPYVVGYDVSGTVDAVGSGVSDLGEGDAVYGHLAYSSGTKRGAFAEHVVISRACVAAKPEGVSHRVAAAAATVGLTALQALRDEGQLPEGGRALIIGAGGGVGAVAVGIAKRLGAEVTAVCSTKDVQRVKALGADVVIDRKKTDPFTIEQHFHVVFDTPSVHSYGKCSHLLESGGAYVCTLPSLGLGLGMVSALFSSKRVSFIGVKSKRADLERLASWLDDGLEVPIDSVHPVSDLAKAFVRQAASDRAGKVVVDVDGAW